MAMLSGTTRALLTPTWRILLLSDGSVTRHLQLLTDTRTQVDVIREEGVGHASEAPGPQELRLFGEQELMQRQVYLKNGESGTIYGYAASWWGVDTYVLTYLTLAVYAVFRCRYCPSNGVASRTAALTD